MLPDVVYTLAYILQQFKSAPNLEAIEIGDNYSAMLTALEISNFNRSIVDLRIDLEYLRGNYDTTFWKAAPSKNEFLRRLVFPKPTNGWYQCSHDSYYQPFHPSLVRLLQAYRHVPELEIIGCIDGCLGWTRTCRGCLDLYDNHLFNVAFTQLRYINLSRTFMGCDLFCHFLQEHSNHLKQLILSNIRLVQGSWKDVFALLQAATEVEEFQMACLYQKHNIEAPKDLDASDWWPHIQVVIRENGVRPFLYDSCKFFETNAINRIFAKVDLLVIPGISLGLDDSIVCSHCS